MNHSRPAHCARARRTDARSAEASSYRRWYKGRVWRSLRRRQLAAYPFCQWQGCYAIATVADHKTPHKGDPALFFELDNLQSLCAPHHDSDKQRQERSGPIGCDADGVPLDPRHPRDRRG